MKSVEIFTDGACRGNPGQGGWGALLRSDGHEKRIKGYEADTTNNRMEMMAAIMALKALKQPSNVHLTTDSEYLKRGISEWIVGWKRRGWKTAAKKPVKNVDLWKMLDAETAHHEIEWCWVRGHTGHRENEIADVLANQAIDEMSIG